MEQVGGWSLAGVERTEDRVVEWDRQPGRILQKAEDQVGGVSIRKAPH